MLASLRSACVLPQVRSFLDVGCGTAYVTALAACLMGDAPGTLIQGIECVGSRLEAACANVRALKDRLAANPMPPGCEVSGRGAHPKGGFASAL